MYRALLWNLVIFVVIGGFAKPTLAGGARRAKRSKAIVFPTAKRTPHRVGTNSLRSIFKRPAASPSQTRPAASTARAARVQERQAVAAKRRSPRAAKPTAKHSAKSQSCSGTSACSSDADYGLLRELHVARKPLRKAATTFLRQMESGRPASVMSHAALLAIVHHKDAAANPTILKRATKALRRSYRALTGKKSANDAELGKLPRRVLLRATSQERAMFAAVRRLDPRLPKWRKNLPGYFPRAKDVVLPLGAAALALSKSGADLVSGLGLGYLIATVTESLLHKHGGHPAIALKKLYKKMGWPGKKMLEIAFGHDNIHHARTYRKHYAKQFASKADKVKLDGELSRMGKLGQKIRETKYGVTLKRNGVLAIIGAHAPSWLAAITFLDMGATAIVGLIAPVALPVLASKVMHPYLHMERDAALAKAGPVMRSFLKSRYAKTNAQLHYGHHRGGGNYNLVWGGDVLTGQYRNPTVKQLVGMHDDKVIH